MTFFSAKTLKINTIHIKKKQLTEKIQRTKYGTNNIKGKLIRPICKVKLKLSIYEHVCPFTILSKVKIFAGSVTSAVICMAEV